MSSLKQPLRVAALVDLPRSAQAGGHVKCWERLAVAATQCDLPLDLTVYFSGDATTEILSPKVRLRHLPPVFSTARLKFLPYVPDHTDLAPYHPALARELPHYDVIHTTDGFFAFAQTAARISRKRGLPLTTSFHTDTPAYTRLFTRAMIEQKIRWGRLRDKLLNDWNIPERQGRAMDKKLARHLRQCRFALVMRDEDRLFAERLIGEDHVHAMRLGVDKDQFAPHQKDRAAIERKYAIPVNRIIVLFVGRVDVGKNIYTLVEAMERGIAEGLPLHLVTAGVGPAEEDVRRRLAGHCSVAGFVAPSDLARLYASVDLFALCSEVEIRSMAGVEAMVSGCPTLVARKSGVAELFHHTQAMQIVESGASNWVDALRCLAKDAARRDRMRETALAYSRDHLARWQDVLTEDLLPVWQQAVEK